MRFQKIKQLIESEFSEILTLDIVDESHLHSGRQGQESHFKILLVSDAFMKKSRVQRQRQLNNLLASEFEQGLHALSLRLLTCEEYQKQKTDFKSPNCLGGSKPKPV